MNGHKEKKRMVTCLDLKMWKEFHKYCKAQHRSVANMLRYLIQRELDTWEQSKDFGDDRR